MNNNDARKEKMVCPQDRACSAASGVIVYLDFKAEKVWAGQVGTTRQLVIGQLFHGLAVQRTAAVVLNDASRCTTTTLWYTALCYGRRSCATVNCKHALLVVTESCPLLPHACYAQCMLCVAATLEDVPTHMHSGSPAVWHAEVLYRV